MSRRRRENMLLFSKRYSNLIEFGDGEPKDYICGEIEYQIKEKIASVMYDFAEPAIIHTNRYDSYEEKTDALDLAVRVFNDEKGVPYIALTHNVFDGPAFNPLAAAFTPFLFDVIELQYKELSDLSVLIFRFIIFFMLKRMACVLQLRVTFFHCLMCVLFCHGRSFPPVSIEKGQPI